MTSYVLILHTHTTISGLKRVYMISGMFFKNRNNSNQIHILMPSVTSVWQW